MSRLYTLTRSSVSIEIQDNEIIKSISKIHLSTESTSITKVNNSLISLNYQNDNQYLTDVIMFNDNIQEIESILLKTFLQDYSKKKKGKNSVKKNYLPVINKSNLDSENFLTVSKISNNKFMVWIIF